MNAVRERQRWLAALALAVAVPLPFTGIATLPFLAPFVAAALWVAASRRALAPLPPWLENTLAPVILVAVVAAGGVRYGILRPVAQLAVLVAAVRLPGCGQRSRAGSVGGILALVGIAGIASSTHPSLGVYLVALLVFVLVAVARLTAVSIGETGRASGWPPFRLVAGSVVVAVLVAAPIFALLPRLRSPFAGAPFLGRSVGGFREAVMLHGIGDVKQSRRLALRVSFPGVAPPRVSPDWLRLAGATMKFYRAGGWVEGRLKVERTAVRPEQAIQLAERDGRDALRRVEISLEKPSAALFLPVGAVTLTMHSPVALSREASGTVRVPRGIDLPLRYAVDFDPARVEQQAPDESDLELPPGSDDLRELAQRITRRSTNDLGASLAVEQYLQRTYRYVLQSYAPIREDPVHWFLFRSHQGHCEFFASSMVLLLRSLRIPARLQAGYAGGEPDGEGGFLVRDSEAHAWVVAYITGERLSGTGDSRRVAAAPTGGAADSRGPWRRTVQREPATAPRGGYWKQFDPTPPEGRPGIGGLGGFQRLAMAWRNLEGFWDRWILTFSLGDQVDLARRAVEAAASAGRHAVRWGPVALALAALAILLLGRGKRGGAAHRPDAGRGPVTGALLTAMQAVTRRGLPVPPAMTARDFAKAAARTFPGIAGPLGWLVREHERFRYAQGFAPGARALRRAARAIESSLKAGSGLQG